MKIAASSILAVAACLSLGSAAIRADSSPEGYSVTKRTVVGGAGSYDYVYADSAGRRLYIPRLGDDARITVYNLDTLVAVGVIGQANAHGVAVDEVSHHGFASSNPVVMWDTASLAVLKRIDVNGRPDGILFEPFYERIWVFSHRSPNATVIDAKTGAIVGTLDLDGAPEQAAADGQGRVYVDLEDKDAVAVVDAGRLAVVARYDISSKGGGPGGLAIDTANEILFVACHDPATMVILDARTGRILGALPIGKGTDGALFNPATDEAFSSNGAAGTLTVIRETSRTSFAVAQTVATLPGARTATLDGKSNRIYLITADFGLLPTAPAAGGHARRPLVPGTFSILTVSR